VTGFVLDSGIGAFVKQCLENLTNQFGVLLSKLRAKENRIWVLVMTLASCNYEGRVACTIW
jgi:hypothetical protein